MSIVVEWDTPNRTVIRFTYTGCWNWHEVRVALAASDAMLDQATVEAVGLICDMRRSDDNLPGKALPAICDLLNTLHPSIRTIVIVADNPHSRLIATLRQVLYTLNQLYDFELRPLFARDLTEARRLLSDALGVASTASIS